ncbi:alpha/beta-hydrolase, partial [Clavulina sp. PMI_390]
IAILLHPWSRVGGNAHDPVLLSFLSSFIRRDYHVITYNSRGVGNSSGSPTWTGFGEAEDLQKVVSLALQEIEEVEEIVLLGYSYGSLAVSMHPARPSALFSAANLARNRHVSPKLRIRHVLLSYPQGVLWLLSFFHSKRYDEALKELINSPGADVLVLYGEHDQFTKKEKYTTWANGLLDMTPIPNPKLQIEVVPEADHFWRSKSSTIRAARAIVENWL